MNPHKTTKAEMIENIYGRSNLQKKDIHRIVDYFLEVVKESLYDDQSVELRGFGTFEIRRRKGREKARNPKTGQSVSVQAHGSVVFRPGKELKEIVWKMRE